MAFAIPKAQKKQLFGVEEHKPGPTDYTPQKALKYSQNVHCAPFNASQVKVSYFDVPETNYGPGSYNTKYHKDINKSNNPTQNSIFASKVQRFKTENYQEKHKKEEPLTISSKSVDQIKQVKENKRKEQLSKNKTLMHQLRNQNNKNKVQSIKGKREFIRVVLTSSINTQMRQSAYVQKDSLRRTIGPGSYQINNTEKRKAKSVSKWKHQHSKRFKEDNTFVPGPGTYKTQSLDEKRIRQSSSFASTSIRSHMDHLIYKTNVPLKIQILKQRKLKDKTPGPGSYNNQNITKDKKSFNYGASSYFGNVQRLQKTQNVKKSTKLGPGYYNPNLLQKGNHCNVTIKERRNQIFKKEKVKSNLQNNQSTQIDFNNGTFNPGERKNNNTKLTNRLKMCSLEQRCFSKLGNMSIQQRFKDKKQSNPGPGQHQNVNYQEIKKGKSAIFHSSSNRQIFSIKEDVPYYNLYRNDIGFKAQKTRRYIQNLKKINVQKSPFQTSSKRFHENGKLEPFEDNYRKQKPRDIPKVVQKSSAFVSSTNRNTFKTDESQPGPGEYNIKMTNSGKYEQMEKKSFNKNYNYELKKPKKPKSIDKIPFEGMNP